MLACAAAATRNDEGTCGSSPVSVTVSSAAESPPTRVQRSAKISRGLCMGYLLSSPLSSTKVIASGREAIHRAAGKNGLLRRGACHRAGRRPDPLAPRNDVAPISDMRPRSRGAMRPRQAKHLSLLRAEGAGKAGCLMHPQPRMQKWKAYELVTTGPPVTPGLPCAMVLTVSFTLSPVTGLSCHRRRPRCESIAACLTPASGRQDHMTSPSALASLVLRHRRVHCIPHPTSVTMRNAPPEGCGMECDIHLICISEKQKYFLCEGWTNGRKRVCKNDPSGKSTHFKRRPASRMIAGRQ